MRSQYKESTTNKLALLLSGVVSQYLADRQYDKLASLLSQTQTEVDNALLNELLQVARQICFTCDVLQDETSWYRWAADEAEQREIELNHSLQVILDVVSRVELTGVNPFFSVIEETCPIPGQNGHSNGNQGLLQRLAYLLRPNTAKSSLPESEANKFSIVAYCLGDFQVYLQGNPVENWPNSKGKLLFKYLILYHNKPIPKEVLMECFWPESDQQLARNNLNVTIYNLRQTLRKTDPEFSYILFKDDCYLLNPDLDIWIDFEVFEDHYQRGRRLEAAGELDEALREYSIAESLYQGELFEYARYEDWPVTQRQCLRDAYLYLWDRLSQQFLDMGNYITCAALCHKMLLVDSCCEDAHRRLMQCYLRQGQHYLALRQYSACVEVHQKELDTIPGPETVALYEEIRSIVLS